MQKYKRYLFDFDYTLVNSEAAILKCFHLTLAEQGCTDPGDDVMRHAIGLAMLKACGIILGTEDEANIRAFIKNYTVNADRYMTAGTHFYPHTVATLRTLREQGAKIGIISSKTRHRIQEKFDQDGVADLVDHILGSDDVQEHKPSPEGINKALAYFGVPREAVLYTGDSYVDAGAAQAAGVDFAGVTTGTTCAADLATYPHVAILQDIGELATLAAAQG